MDKPVANMVLVPVDPTKEMIGAVTRVDFDNEDEVAMTINLWHAMLASAPQPSLEGEVGQMVERLRKRYTAEPVPPCSVCGLPMSIQSAGGGNATVYGCEAHRPFDWKHYEQSRWTQYRPGDEDVLAAAALLQSLSADNTRLRASLIDAASWVDECYRAWGPQGIREPSAEPYSDGVPSRMGAIRAAIGGGRQALSEGEQT